MHKLLLADDSVTIQRVIELTFSGEDIDVVAVNDGEQAIARIPTERPDIVLADIGMPKKGGYDVAAFVKGRIDLEHIPVLLLAGAFEPVDQARAEQVRCDGVLIKPFEPRQVIERVRELLEGMKGSPARATADVPRPVEVLAPRVEPPSPPPMLAESATIVESDAALDEYFESLNAAFDSVGPAAAPVAAADAPEAPPTDAPRRRGDSLDDYFDRLSSAFEQSRPADEPKAGAESADDASDDSRVPTVDALVSSPKVSVKVNGHGPRPDLNGHARNPIVEALEAMLGHPEALPQQQMLPGLPETHTNGDGASASAAPSNLADCVT
jgi:CheY-like chemotaxis protein